MRGVTISGVHAGGDLIEPPEFDTQGNPKVTIPEAYEIKHCLLAPSGQASSGSTETAEPFGSFVVSQVQVIALKSVPDVRPSDILTFWGKEWQMQGIVGPWEKGRLFGSVFMVKRAS